ncbi:MAG: OsmC family protein [Thermoanaerobaculia bacterium]|nr:OsmC family protein [Thermoanaerobaculia bacterium]
MSAEHVFRVAATWDSASKEGTLENADGSLRIAHAAALSLGGKTGTPNPEELLLAAVSSCFVQTWAIFLAKLQLPIERPALDGSCEVDKDPSGGFLVTKMNLAPRVPAALWESRRADVEKTLALAEKYCIVSKAVKGSLALTIAPKPV